MPTISLRAAVATALLFGASFAATAQATSSNVVASIKAQDKLIKRTPGFHDLNYGSLKTRADVQKLVPELGPLEQASAHAVAVVAKSTTSTAKQRQGKADWLKATQEQDRGLLEFRTALRDRLAGKKSAKAEYNRAFKIIGAGVTLGDKADKLLGLPTDD